ncbi:MAG: arsenate reductase ArsC [Epsilonproteobacteria bacterium]|uniref:Low molecular weight phosphatase family protein n=1 Tax=Sulfurospirillum cavolei TaxID=366522 RepID=A0A2D3WC51_9BACT|nr:arsenate reductase ArsC [Sulfurospirillum cavolei]NCB53562.1 arsenate reductase ArsC [Campylobacterota bacterium]DAB36660.1 MAG TPA: low molecular weight phosphatase family protein [Sulfurospirillum cavolei]
MVKVLFVCIHNSARSQIAEALLKKYGGDHFNVQSAGLQPGLLNPLAVEILKEEDIDIAGKETQSVFDLFKDGKLFNYVITVCDEGNSQRCPIFPGQTKRIHWSFEDPSTFQGDHEAQLAKIRHVKEEIKIAVLAFIAQTA